MKRRVVVTAMGTVNPLGSTVAETWTKAKNGVSGVDFLKSTFEKEHSPIKIAGEVKNFSLDEHFFSAKEAAKYDRFNLLALKAAQEALKDFSFLDPETTGCIMGTGIGGFQTIEEQHQIYRDRGATRVSPFFIPSIHPNTPEGLITILYKLNGPNFAVSSACASSLHAQALAYEMILSGKAKTMVTGGVESVLTAMTIASFNSMRALSKREDDPRKASRPFDQDRDGFIMSEGATVFVFEDYEQALKRGAVIYGEVIGYGASSDAYHMTAPEKEGFGASLAMERALKDAQISKDQVDYINMHGTSTPLGDIAETKAVKRVFQDQAYQLSLNSTKSMTGHLLGGAGALETLFCLKSLEENIITPTINLDQADPECDLDYTPLKAKEKKITYALNNSFGFGGTNCTMVFKKFL